MNIVKEMTAATTPNKTWSALRECFLNGQSARNVMLSAAKHLGNVAFFADSRRDPCFAQGDKPCWVI